MKLLRNLILILSIAACLPESVHAMAKDSKQSADHEIDATAIAALNKEVDFVKALAPKDISGKMISEFAKRIRAISAHNEKARSLVEKAYMLLFAKIILTTLNHVEFLFDVLVNMAPYKDAGDRLDELHALLTDKAFQQLINFESDNSGTLFLMGVAADDNTLVDALIKYKANINLILTKKPQIDGFCYLWFAMSANNLPMFIKLIDAGADINIKLPVIDLIAALLNSKRFEMLKYVLEKNKAQLIDAHGNPKYLAQRNALNPSNRIEQEILILMKIKEGEQILDWQKKRAEMRKKIESAAAEAARLEEENRKLLAQNKKLRTKLAIQNAQGRRLGSQLQISKQGSAKDQEPEIEELIKRKQLQQACTKTTTTASASTAAPQANITSATGADVPKAPNRACRRKAARAKTISKPQDAEALEKARKLKEEEDAAAATKSAEAAAQRAREQKALRETAAKELEREKALEEQIALANALARKSREQERAARTDAKKTKSNKKSVQQTRADTQTATADAPKPAKAKKLSAKEIEDNSLARNARLMAETQAKIDRRAKFARAIERIEKKDLFKNWKEYTQLQKQLMAERGQRISDYFVSKAYALNLPPELDYDKIDSAPFRNLIARLKTDWHAHQAFINDRANADTAIARYYPAHAREASDLKEPRD